MGRCDYRGVCVGGADMREATLYTVQQQRVVCGDYLEMARQFGPMPPLSPMTDGDALYPVDSPSVEVERLPVHAISKIQHGQRIDDYIVLDSELREILEAPFTSQIEKLEWERAKLIRECKQYAKDLEGYELRLERFNTANWFLRVWHVICGGLV